MFRNQSYDFGRDRKQEPKAVISPRTLDDIKGVLTGSEDTTVAIRGKAHCTGGQSLAADGTVIDMKSYSNINKITENDDGGYVVEIEAGALWKDVFNYCLGKRLMPPTYADWLDLTVGGTVSTGGVGQCSFKKGLQIDNVVALEVVTGKGDVYFCDKDKNFFLFDLARGGLGQYGVISRVWMKLEPSPNMVVVHKLLYTDLHQYLLAQTKLTEFEKIDAIQSHIVINEKAELCRRVTTDLSEDIYNVLPAQLFIIEVTQYACKATDEFKQFLNENSDIQPLYAHSYEASFEQHVNRVPPLLQNPLEQGNPMHHHCCFFIGASQTSELLNYVFLQKDHAEAMGKGTILIIPLKRSLIRAPYFILSEEEDQFFVGILRRHLNPCEFEQLIQINECTYQKVLELGGYVYPVGSGSFLNDPAFWEAHYGSLYSVITEGKRQFDPGSRLSPNINFCKKNE